MRRLWKWLTHDEGPEWRGGDGLSAFYWDGRVPRPHRVNSLTHTGAALESGSLIWPVGTILSLTIRQEQERLPIAGQLTAITLRSEIVAVSQQRMEVRFFFTGVKERRSFQKFLTAWISSKPRASVGT